MGRDKAWIEWEGRPLIVHAFDRARRVGAAEILISGRADAGYERLGCPVLLDRVPGLGPLSGIEQGLEVCRSPLLLVIAVDLPRLSSGLLQRLLDQCDDDTGVVPGVKERIEPLVAVYPKRCHPVAVRLLAEGRLAVRDFALACVRVAAVRRVEVPEEDAGCFANWNLPGEVPPAESGGRNG